MPVDDQGWEGKKLYVWFEAVIGYLSAAIEWAQVSGEGASWQEWWANPAARQFYFIGKDNIFFHTSLWPAELMGVGEQFGEIFAGRKIELTLPYDVPANQFMNLEGQKISGSRNWAVWGSRLPKPLRPRCPALLPDHQHAREQGQRLGLEGVRGAQQQRAGGHLGQPGQPRAFVLLSDVGRPRSPGRYRPPCVPRIWICWHISRMPSRSIGQQLESVHLRASLQDAMRLASLVNQYLDQTAPWTTIKQNREEAALSVFTALKAIDSLKVLFAPFLPFTSQRLHEFFGYDSPLFGEQYVQEIGDSLGIHRVLRYRAAARPIYWQPSQLQPGRKLNLPGPLFKKLDDSIVQQERSRLGG